MAGLLETPSANRLKISFFGRTNSGKSSVINALSGTTVSLVSSVSGTTTDPVNRAMEIYPLGPCLLTDTAGFGDDTALGEKRVEKTDEVLRKTDLAVMVFSPEESDISLELLWLEKLKNENIPTVCALNKIDVGADVDSISKKIIEQTKLPVVKISALKNEGIDSLKEAIVAAAPKDFEEKSICAHLVSAGDSVMLVCPQQINAPKGRLILPQVQTIRDLLDIGAVVTVVQPDKMKDSLCNMKKNPDLIICDSQEFAFVYENKPEGVPLTSFSALMARYKGDIDEFVLGAEKIFLLKETDRVLIAEACAHAPLEEDIGRVKIPAMLKKIVGEGLSIDIVSGNDFPKDLSPYALIIHCGGCMFSKRHMLSRVANAKKSGVAITNYGIFIAKIKGILDKITI